MADNQITVTNNNTKAINLEIVDNNNIVNVDFTETINLHNSSSTAHQTILSDLEAKVDLKADSSNVTAALASKVDLIPGKSLSTNDLTNILKSNYDTAYINNHTHLNKSTLDSLRGINTGDQDLSLLANISLNNINPAAKNTISALGMPDYVNGVTGVTTFQTWKTVNKDSLVVVSVTYSVNSGSINITIKDSTGSFSRYVASAEPAQSTSTTVSAFIPKGYSYYLDYYGVTFGSCYEYPIKGAN